jgi:hypothetical protein
MSTSIYPVPLSGIQETTIDAKGDLIVGTGADAVSRLAVGTNNYILTADSAEATGMKWAAASSGSGMTLISTTSFSAASAVNVNNCFSSTYDSYKIISTFIPSDNTTCKVRFRNSGSNITTSTYYMGISYYSTGTRQFDYTNGTTEFNIGNAGPSANFFFSAEFTDVFASTPKMGSYTSMWATTGYGEMIQGPFKNTTASSIDGFSIAPNTGTFTGFISIYGLAK